MDISFVLPEWLKMDHVNHVHSSPVGEAGVIIVFVFCPTLFSEAQSHRRPLEMMYSALRHVHSQDSAL